MGSLKKVLDGIPMSLADFFSVEVQPAGQVFFLADELVELAGGAVSCRQVGRDPIGRTIQILHERYTPGADTGETMLRHDSEEAGIVVRGRLEVRWMTSGGGWVQAVHPISTAVSPHRFRNVGDERCEVVSACAPPSF